MRTSDIYLQGFILLISVSIISLGVSYRFYPWVKSTLVAYRERQEVAFKEAAVIVNPLVQVSPSPEVKISPNRVRIPKLNLDLAVDQATIENNQWTLYDDKVSWLASSAEPKKGNVVLYAHNRKHLFGSLVNLVPGDLVDIEHQGKQYSYEIEARHRVSPTDVDAVIAERDQLTLYTCDGAFDQKRLIVTALPVQN
jgi:LPXTG-site transpeptidase (sortase) family protein